MDQPLFPKETVINIKDRLIEKFTKVGILKAHASHINARMNYLSEEYKRAIIYKHLKNLCDTYSLQLIREALEILNDDERLSMTGSGWKSIFSTKTEGEKP